MPENPSNSYLKAKIMTASPEQLQLMLYDGAIRFCEQARQAMADKDIPATHDRLLRAQRIVMELSSGLKPDLNPHLCGKLASLYNYVYRLLVQANLEKTEAPLSEAITLLHYQRDTWQLLLQKLREDQPSVVSPAGEPASDDQPDGSVDSARPISGSLCLEG